MTLAKGVKLLVVQEALLAILSELSYFSWFTCMTTMRVLVEGGEMMTLWPHPQVGPGHLHGGEETSRLHNILSTSIIPFDVGGILLQIDGHGHSVDDKLPVLSLDLALGLL